MIGNLFACPERNYAIKLRFDEHLHSTKQPAFEVKHEYRYPLSNSDTMKTSKLFKISTKTAQALGLLTLSGYVYSASPITTAPNIVINGKITAIKAQKVGDRVMVDLKDLASEEKWNVQVTPSVVSIQHADNVTPKPGPGKISGTLVYYFNQNYGSRADTGSKIGLVDESVAFEPKDEDFVLFFGQSIRWVRADGQKIDVPVKFFTQADGNGHFELGSVPQGTYTLIMSSAHSKGRNKRDISGKVETSKITVNAGENIDKSKDFGMSDF